MLYSEQKFEKLPTRICFLHQEYQIIIEWTIIACYINVHVNAPIKKKSVINLKHVPDQIYWKESAIKHIDAASDLSHLGEHEREGAVGMMLWCLLHSR